MSALVWNCRGLGIPQTVRDLCQLVKEKRPRLVFLIETKMVNKKIEFLRIKLGFDQMFVVNCVGRSGGLALLWNDDFQLTIQNFSHRHINAVIKRQNDGIEWKFSGFYGHPETAKRKEAWALLRHIALLSPTPWLCIGDFNEILHANEKWGGASRVRSQMEDFQGVLTDCHLSDLGYSGPKYTWTNGRHGTDFTKERLDRAVANGEWCSIFPDVEVSVLARRSSDHNPIFINFDSKSRDGRRRKGIFRYDARWSKIEGTKNIIKKLWRPKQRDENPWTRVKLNLSSCRQSLKNSVKKYELSNEEAIRRKTAALEKLQSKEGEPDFKAEDEVKAELHGLLEQEEIRWRQNAKVEWLKNGD
jgi:exonuclease III